MTFNIQYLDLYSDWLEIIKTELQNEGHQTNHIDSDKLSILYFTFQKKLIRPMCRTVLKSDVFNCPPHLAEGLNVLEQKIIHGESLRPYLSRKLKNLDEQDGLLFDWGIYHLHLGTFIEADGFIERTGPLLYARFNDQSAYFINILTHGAWTTQELLKIIHRNWPDSIRSYRLKDVIGVANKFEDNQIKKLRNAQINTMIEVDEGAVYMGPGGGLAASGDSADAVRKHLDNQRGIEQFQKRMTNDVSKVLNELFENLDFIRNENLVFKLKKENGKFFIDEINNEFQILFE
jgi:hypothetical protein